MKKLQKQHKSLKLRIKSKSSLLVVALLFVSAGYFVAYNVVSAQMASIAKSSEPTTIAPINTDEVSQNIAKSENAPVELDVSQKNNEDKLPEDKQTQVPTKVIEKTKDVNPTINTEPAPANTQPEYIPPQVVVSSAETASSLSFINSLRLGLGKSALVQNSTMNQWALNHAKKLASECSLYHQNISAFLSQNIGPVTVMSIAENVGYASSTSAVLENLKNSPGHYANMTGDYTYVGLGVTTGSGACASYTYTTQLFAK